MRIVRDLLIAFLVLGAASTAETATGGKATVIDGNTIELQGRHARLPRIDVPESARRRWSAGQEPRCDHVAQSCCKVCRTGKACGKSCINRSKTCTKPPGCACDGN